MRFDVQVLRLALRSALEKASQHKHKADSIYPRAIQLAAEEGALRTALK